MPGPLCHCGSLRSYTRGSRTLPNRELCQHCYMGYTHPDAGLCSHHTYLPARASFRLTDCFFTIFNCLHCRLLGELECSLLCGVGLRLALDTGGLACPLHAELHLQTGVHCSLASLPRLGFITSICGIFSQKSRQWRQDPHHLLCDVYGCLDESSTILL